MFELSKPQLKILSNFFCDVAKGLFLGVAVNQAVSVWPPLFKLINSFLGIVAALFFLYLSLLFAKDRELI